MCVGGGIHEVWLHILSYFDPSRCAVHYVLPSLIFVKIIYDSSPARRYEKLWRLALSSYAITSRCAGKRSLQPGGFPKPGLPACDEAWKTRKAPKRAPVCSFVAFSVLGAW